MEMIQLEHVSYIYRAEDDVEGRRALDDLSLSIKSGEFVAILGHNGSGKSTLAKLLNGILLPAEGTVRVKGMDTKEDNFLYEIRKTCGMVFQNPDNQLVATVVEEDVAFALENMGVPPDEIRRRVDEALRIVRMEDYKTHAPHLLSGGQKQRVAIAGIVAMHPECIVMDEPTAMLDPMGRQEVMDTVCRLNKEQGVTVVLVTHHMTEAAMADRVVILADGRLHMDGPPEMIFKQVEELEKVGLAAPQTVRLMAELQKAGLNAPLTALSDEACAEALKRLLEDESEQA